MNSKSLLNAFAKKQGFKEWGHFEVQLERLAVLACEQHDKEMDEFIKNMEKKIIANEFQKFIEPFTSDLLKSERRVKKK